MCKCGYFDWAASENYFGREHQQWVSSMGPGWVLMDDEGRLQTISPVDGRDTLDDGTPLVHRLEDAARRWAEHLRHLYGWALRPARYDAVALGGSNLKGAPARTVCGKARGP